MQNPGFYKSKFILQKKLGKNFSLFESEKKNEDVRLVNGYCIHREGVKYLSGLVQLI